MAAPAVGGLGHGKNPRRCNGNGCAAKTDVEKASLAAAQRALMVQEKSGRVHFLAGTGRGHRLLRRWRTKGPRTASRFSAG